MKAAECFVVIVFVCVNHNHNDKTNVKWYIYHKVCKKSPNNGIFSEMNLLALFTKTEAIVGRRPVSKKNKF